MKRCDWCTDDPLYINYHDEEWGIPVYDDRALFEMLILEGAQAGLNWLTVLRKRENYRTAFSNFDAVKIAKYSDEKLNKILQNPGVIRNRLKIYAVRQNAQAFLKVQKEFSSFSEYIWQFIGHKPVKNKWRSLSEVPDKTGEAETMSKDLKKRGFTFVGPTICYAFMQAVGMVDDHLVTCARYRGAYSKTSIKR